MMDDHFVISFARNELADALKVLLNAGFMGVEDFSKSRDHVVAALEALDDLLRVADRDAA